MAEQYAFVKLVSGEDVVGEFIERTKDEILLADIMKVFYVQDLDGAIRFTLERWLPDKPGESHALQLPHIIVVTECTDSVFGRLYGKRKRLESDFDGRQRQIDQLKDVLYPQSNTATMH